MDENGENVFPPVIETPEIPFPSPGSDHYTPPGIDPFPSPGTVNLDIPLSPSSDLNGDSPNSQGKSQASRCPHCQR